jgi:aromatic-amino-acid transaminase
MKARVEFLIPARTSRPSDDPIFSLNAEAVARTKKGESIINATLGAIMDDDGQLAVLSTVIDAIRGVPATVEAGYAPLAGPVAYHHAVIGDLLGKSPLAEHAIAVATTGGTGALRHAVSCFLEPKQALLTTSRYWSPYKTIADENDRAVDTFEMFDGDGELDVAALSKKVDEHLETQGRVLLFINDPCQNPTGYTMHERQWRAVVDVLLAASTRGPITLLVDVAYWLWGFGDPHAMLPWLEPLLGKVGLAFAWSASKSFTQYGARVGALVFVDPDAGRRKRTLDALAYACRGTWSNCNAAGMAAITQVLTDPSLHAKVDAERRALQQLLNGRVKAFNEIAKKTLRYPRYDGGFFSTVFVPGKTVAEAQRAAAAMREDGVYVVPIADSLRVALCSVAERDVPRLVKSLQKAVGG